MPFFASNGGTSPLHSLKQSRDVRGWMCPHKQVDMRFNHAYLQNVRALLTCDTS